MPEAYCVKCKSKREMKNPKEHTTANNRKMLKGKCPKCDTTMCRIMGKSAAGASEITGAKKSRKSRKSRKSKMGGKSRKYSKVHHSHKPKSGAKSRKSRKSRKSQM